MYPVSRKIVKIQLRMFQNLFQNLFFGNNLKTVQIDMAHISGISIPDDVHIEGWNVWPAVTGKGVLGERVLYWRTGNLLAVRKGGWKLIHRGKTVESGKDELYNIAKDPFEQTDHSSENPEKLKELRQEMINQLSQDLDN